jgi:putative transposase
MGGTPRTPTSNTVRYDWLVQALFVTIDAMQALATRWLWTYNNERSTMALGGITPSIKLALAA